MCRILSRTDRTRWFRRRGDPGGLRSIRTSSPFFTLRNSSKKRTSSSWCLLLRQTGSPQPKTALSVATSRFPPSWPFARRCCAHWGARWSARRRSGRWSAWRVSGSERVGRPGPSERDFGVSGETVWKRIPSFTHYIVYSGCLENDPLVLVFLGFPGLNRNINPGP